MNESDRYGSAANKDPTSPVKSGRDDPRDASGRHELKCRSWRARAVQYSDGAGRAVERLGRYERPGQVPGLLSTVRMTAEASLTSHVGMSASRYTVALRAASPSSTDPQRRCVPVRHVGITISHDRGKTGAPISRTKKCEGTASTHRMGQLLACPGIAAAVLALAD